MALSSPPVIVSVQAIPVRLPRDLKAATGSAGSPSQLTEGAFAYRWSSTVKALYSTFFETCLVKITLSNGLIGWGEAQAPLAPRVAATIVEDLLRPVLVGQPFNGSFGAIEHFWDEMYSTMRVRGQTTGFMIDAMAGVDIALWDLAGHLHSLPVSWLIAGEQAKASVPAYLSGLTGAGVSERTEFAARHFSEGFRLYKIFFDQDETTLLNTLDALRERLGREAYFAVDALWRLDPESALRVGKALDERKAFWLEAPLMPEDAAAHYTLRNAISTPIALGESYRTALEMEPFFALGALQFLQPDLGRTGITGGLRLAARAAAAGVEVVPHVSIALAPQIAAALHFAAGVSQCRVCEYNPAVAEIANRYSNDVISVRNAAYQMSASPGLGISVNETHLFRDMLPVG